ncbi:Uncharacterised protein [uncultured archaeon]|nr:Uncharacterised protein [uncultured archaeon]
MIDHLTVDPGIGKEFRQFVLGKHGKIRGALKEETAAAIKSHMASASKGKVK